MFSRAEGRLRVERGWAGGSQDPHSSAGAALWSTVFCINILLIFKKGSAALKKEVKRALEGGWTFIECQPLVQWFSTGGDFAPQGTFSNGWRHFWLSQLGGHYWHLVGKARDADPTMHKIGPHSQQRIIWRKMSILPSLRNPAPCEVSGIQRWAKPESLPLWSVVQWGR